ncbi:MAG: hypothetical protein KGL39_45400 [Patescibacteria group bacterium]|nr:hypothetical protein [Patescibacteria group bacterium]
MIFGELLLNIQTWANQTASRVRVLNQGMGVMGARGCEQFDQTQQRHRLPTPDEFLVAVHRNIGPPHTGGRIRCFTTTESRQLAHFTRRIMRLTRRDHPQLT